MKLLTELQQSAEKPDAREARLRIASIEYGAGRKAEAHRHLDELITERPRFAAARTAKARMLLSDGAPPAEAVAQAREAVKADPYLAAAQYTLGLAAVADHKLDEAEKAFETAAQLSPQAAAQRASQLARVKLARGDAAGARARSPSSPRTSVRPTRAPRCCSGRASAPAAMPIARRMK